MLQHHSGITTAGYFIDVLKCMCIYIYIHTHIYIFELPYGLVSKESACNAGDPDSIPGSRISPREGNGIPLQYSCLGNPKDRGAWWAAVHGFTRVRHYLASKPPLKNIYSLVWLHQLFVAALGIFYLWHSNYLSSVWGLVPSPGIEPGPLARRVRNDSQWITREVPDILCLWN